MVALNCSSCGTKLLSCGCGYVNPIAYVSCLSCYNNGLHKQKVKDSLGLTDLSAYNTIQKEFQQYKTKYTIELATHKTLDSQFQTYKGRYPCNERDILRTLLNAPSYQMIKIFDQFKKKIRRKEPKFSNILQLTTSRMFKSTEQFIKSQIVKQTRYLTQLILAESSQIQKLKLEVKTTRDELKIKLQSSPRTWQDDEIRQLISLFDKKIRKYDNQTEICGKLNKQGQDFVGKYVVNVIKQSSVKKISDNSSVTTTESQKNNDQAYLFEYLQLL